MSQLIADRLDVLDTCPRHRLVDAVVLAATMADGSGQAREPATKAAR